MVAAATYSAHFRRSPNPCLSRHSRSTVAAERERALRWRTFATLAARRGRSLDDLALGMGHGADVNATVAKGHNIAPGMREAGAAGRVLGVLDGSNARKGKAR